MIHGYIEIDRGRFLTRDWRRGLMWIELYAAANYTRSDKDLSELRVHQAGRKVLDIRWNEAGAFKVVVFEQGEWEQSLE